MVRTTHLTAKTKNTIKTWYLDSGVNDHYTGDNDAFNEFNTIDTYISCTTREWVCSVYPRTRKNYYLKCLRASSNIRYSTYPFGNWSGIPRQLNSTKQIELRLANCGVHWCLVSKHTSIVQTKRKKYGGFQLAAVISTSQFHLISFPCVSRPLGSLLGSLLIETLVRGLGELRRQCYSRIFWFWFPREAWASGAMLDWADSWLYIESQVIALLSK